MAQAGLLVGLLGLLWSGLFVQPHPGRVAGLCLLGAAPALALLSPRRPRALAALVALGAVAGAVALAARVSPLSLVTLDRASWSTLASVLPDGLRATSDTAFPVAPGAPPALRALLDCALVVACALCAWQVVVRRRPLVGVAVVAVALAYRWTVVPPESPVGQGALALAVVLAVLALDPARRGRPARGIGLAAAAVGVAALLGAGPLGGSGAWWNWRDWSVGGAEAAAAPYTLDLQQRYGQLDWPRRPTVVLRVAADQGLPLRAAVLDQFDGAAFTASPTATGAVRRDGATLTLPGPPGGGAEVEQRITLVAGDSSVLLAGGRPVSFTGAFDGRATVAFGGVRVDPPLQHGASYVVRTRVPEPSPSDLLRRRAYPPGAMPDGLTEVTAGYGGQVVSAPLWGTGAAPPPERYGPYAGLAVLARRLAGSATSPYAAVNRIEGWLRSHLIYDESPPYPPAGTLPLVDFVERTHRGFCQHFAGAMALMLRTLGIPTRVAVGFTQGHWDATRRDYEVLDRDAHSWVEVLLPGVGWLPFDPTPGRSAPNPASVSSPDYTPAAATVRAGGLESGSVRAPRQAGPAPAAPGSESSSGAEPAAAPAGGGPSWAWALLTLAVLPLAVPAAKLLRRARRRRAGGERARVLGAVHELESRLADLGHPVDPAAAPAERAAAIGAALGVDVTDLYARAAAARYGPEPGRGQAASAWRELARATRRIGERTPRARRLVAAFRPGSLRREARMAR